MIVAAALALAGCDGSGGGHPTTGSAASVAQPAPAGPAARPQASGDVPDADRVAVTAAVQDYVNSLDRHDAAGVCALFAPGALDLSALPRRQGGCVASLGASIGVPPRGGAPAWRNTELLRLETKTLGEERTRVTATVTHHFSDRKYVSVEDDVIYLERVGGRWLLAQPSGTFYRAVGYPEPPLKSLAPPAGW
jgi:hypothetical protein